MAFSYAGAVASIDKRKAKDREDFLREEDLANSRENSFLQLHLSSLKEKSTFKNSPAAIAAASDAVKFKTRISADESLSVEQRDIYNGIATTDPFAAQELYNFQNEQALKFQRNLNLSQIYDLITINSMEAPIEEKIETVKATTDIDFRNKEEYIQAMESLASINNTPGRSTIIDFAPSSSIDATKKIKLESDQLNVIMQRLEYIIDAQIKEQLIISKGSEDASARSKALERITTLQGYKKDRLSKDLTIASEAKRYYLSLLNEDILNEFITDSPDILRGAENIHEIKQGLIANQATNPGSIPTFDRTGIPQSVPTSAIKFLIANPSPENIKAFNNKYNENFNDLTDGENATDRILGL